MKKKYRIMVIGCDDSTIIIKELTEKELELIKSITNEVNKTSRYICMPTMEIMELGKKEKEND